MSAEGASWWRTLVVSQPASDRGSERKHYMLFETFEQNARKHEVLRVSWSDGGMALEGTYGHDEIFFGNGSTRMAEVSSEMRSVIDEGREGSVAVRSDVSAAHGYTIIIQLRSTTQQVKLEPKAEIAAETFVDRIVSYMRHIEAQLHFDLDRRQSRQKKHGILQERVSEAVGKKQEEDRRLEIGLRFLMKEKLDYWSRRENLIDR